MSATEQQPHRVYDGIEENDHRLPNWWLFMLWGTIVFAFGYWFWVQLSGRVPDAYTRYQQEAAERARHTPDNRALTDDALLALSHDAHEVTEGKQVFQTQCAACHGPMGQGVIGPNLTDDYWLHGGKPTQILATVTDGVQAKGMPTWAPVLGAQRVREVVAYVLTIKNTHVPGKAPQGDPESGAAVR